MIVGYVSSKAWSFKSQLITCQGRGYFRRREVKKWEKKKEKGKNGEMNG